MTSKDSQSAKFIDLHGHHTELTKLNKSILGIYSYSPGINTPPSNQSYFSAGVHPWKLTGYVESFKEVEGLGRKDDCLLIGEAGLDRSIAQDFTIQEEVFRQHIDLANKLNKPLVIHCVKSLSDIFRLHKEYQGHTPWILHDFNAGVTDLNNCHSKGIYTCFGPRFYESSTAKISSTLLNNKIDLEYIFFETDDRRDICITDIYTQFAARQAIDINQLRIQVWNNLAHLLGKNLTT